MMKACDIDTPALLHVIAPCLQLFALGSIEET